MNALLMSDRLVASLAWMLVHFLWQGFAVGLLLAAAVRFGRIRRATSRYFCSLVALMALAAAPFVTLLLMLPAPQRTVELFRPEIPLMSNPVDMPHHNSIEAQAANGAAQPGIAAVNGVVPPTLPNWEMVQRVIVGAWLCGVAVLLMRLVVGWMGVLRLHSESLAAPDWLNVRLREIARAIQVTVPLLRISERITEAMAFGIVKPMIPTAGTPQEAAGGERSGRGEQTDWNMEADAARWRHIHVGAFAARRRMRGARLPEGDQHSRHVCRAG